MSNGYINYKLPFSIAMLNYQTVGLCLAVLNQLSEGTVLAELLEGNESAGSAQVHVVSMGLIAQMVRQIYQQTIF